MAWLPCVGSLNAKARMILVFISGSAFAQQLATPSCLVNPLAMLEKIMIINRYYFSARGGGNPGRKKT